MRKFVLRPALALLLCGAACDSRPAAHKAAPTARAPIPVYADGAEGLQRLWEDILKACQKDDRERVHELLLSLALTKEELGGLLGVAVASERWPDYQFQVGSMANMGAVELVAFVYDKKLDEVVVKRVDELPKEQQGATNQAVLERTAGPLYMVQLRRKPAEKGLRYDALRYINGRWRMLAALGRKS